MKLKKPILLNTCLFFSVLSSSVALAKKSAVETLSKKQFIASVAGNTVRGNGWNMLVSTDGQLRGVEGSYGDQGNWNINNDGLFCRTWNSWGQGQESCFMVSLKKQTKLKFKQVSGPTATFTGKLLLGNPYKL